MNESTSPMVIERVVTVPASAERAFAVFTDGMGMWWPSQYTWAQEDLDDILIEPREGGRALERDADGTEREWGRVLAVEPPHRLVFSWQIAPDRSYEPDPARSSEVEVRFVPQGQTTTRVELEHRAFERHGEHAAAYREGLDAGWDELLAAYAAALK